MRDMRQKIECPKCGKMFQSLGYASHRAMHRIEREKNGSCPIMDEETIVNHHLMKVKTTTTTMMAVKVMAVIYINRHLTTAST